ncbi:MAG: GTPase ObgE, partial [Clostridia bacterium]|nr:GTPase ObgE [Clostridia bacterium]
MFLDKAKITIKAGDGGKGAISFIRNKMTATGGPDGGDGGKGGDIVFKATKNLNTLYGFRYKRKTIAENGHDGGKTNCTGKNGKDVIIEVPCGTVIYDATSNKVIADMREDRQLFTALKGGLGGRGNSYFATSTRRAPRFSQTGEICEEKEIILELKTIADVGLVGFPNVGKSTLLSVISAARPKIADYAFTTLTPNLGVVSYFENIFVVADIPGLIEGASEGIGLGHDFLKHIERVRLILHMVDISETDGRNAVEDYKILNKELKNYSQKLAELPQIIALTKCDLLKEQILKQKIENFKIEVTKILNKNREEKLQHTKNVVENEKVETVNENLVEIIPISAVTLYNIDKLKGLIWNKLKDLPQSDDIEVEEFDFDKRDKVSVEISQKTDGSFVLSGGYIDNLIRG